jgi:hypothetical protein
MAHGPALGISEGGKQFIKRKRKNEKEFKLFIGSAEVLSVSEVACIVLWRKSGFSLLMLVSNISTLKINVGVLKC